jgi:UDP-2,4-diacetamido-2,4,6-trideoxy-beta-L-altropyranose hydrolase
MALRTLLIRADANVEIGTGHVMRCLALAQAWQDIGGSVIFVSASSTPAILERLKAENCEVTVIGAAAGSSDDADDTCRIAESQNVEWLVLDGADFHSTYQQTVRTTGRRILYIDDFGECDYYSADLILNQNSNAAESVYHNRAPNSQLLLTPAYALLRREFKLWTGWQRPIANDVKKVLISMGGSDPDGLTYRIYTIGGFSGFETIFLVGGSAVSRCEFTREGAGHVLNNQNNMPALMSECDITVICGGGTLWESMFMGCATISYSRNWVQEEVIRCLQMDGGVVDVGRIETFDYDTLAATVTQLGGSPDQRTIMSRLGRELVDGFGASRVVEVMRSAS